MSTEVISCHPGCCPYPLATKMLIYLMQQRYAVGEPAMKNALIGVPTMGLMPRGVMAD